MQFPSQNSRFPCNRPDGPLKAFGRPTVFRSFSIEERSNVKETPFGRRGNTTGHCPGFHNILSFLFECGKELWRRPSGRLAKTSERGPCYGTFQRYFGNVVAVDRPDAQSSRPDDLQYFDHNFLLKYQYFLES